MSKREAGSYLVYCIIFIFLFFCIFITAEKPSNTDVQGTHNKQITQKEKVVNIRGLRLLKLLWFYKADEWPKKFFHSEIGVVENERQKNLRSYFINHASHLIQINGYNILTDPVWAKAVGPYNIGIKRITNPGLKIEDLPPIDYVIISHNHYDHLDLYTFKKLKKKYPNLKIIVPNKVEKIFFAFGFKKKSVITMLWNQTITLPHTLNADEGQPNSEKLKITCTPAKHFSGRGLFDKNKTLWAGYIVSSGGYNVYFAGDTAFSQKMFEQIACMAPKFHICLLPIGAYKPRNLLLKVHINPDEAVEIHKILKSHKSVPMHYGTFRLSIERFDDPLNDLKAALQGHGYRKDEFAILKHGAFLDCVDNFSIENSTPVYKIGFIKDQSKPRKN